uniref:Uncharacterized protein n=1 Tax=Kalanchoe fedtschenkoi TaxID=63787 RepID=A0A7N0SXQ1_KALFE
MNAVSSSPMLHFQFYIPVSVQACTTKAHEAGLCRP